MLVALALSLSFSNISHEPPTAAAQVNKVLVIGLDGCRPDALEVAETPYIDGLIENGAYAVGLGNPRSSSGPCWSSILCGVWSDKHGVIDNSFTGSNYAEYPDFLTLVERLKPSLRTVGITAWTPIADKIIQVADYEGPQTGDGDDVTAREVAAELRTNDPDVIFVHFDDPDIAGHTYGYGPDIPKYVEVIEEADAKVGVILNALRGRSSYAEENWLIILTSDHGGTGYGHGLDIPEHVNIPFIVSGSDAASEFSVVPKQVDVAPTVMAHLGIELDNLVDFDGIPVGLAAFDSEKLAISRGLFRVGFYPDDTFHVGTVDVYLAHSFPDLDVRFTTDGSLPTVDSPLSNGAIKLEESTTIRAAAFSDERRIGPTSSKAYFVQKEIAKSVPLPDNLKVGILYAVFEGEFSKWPEEQLLKATKSGISDRITHEVAGLEENYAILFEGYYNAPAEGVYEFALSSDDGSKLWIDDVLVVDHDGLHGTSSKSGFYALEAGHHHIRVGFFQAGGAHSLKLGIKLPDGTAIEPGAAELAYVVRDVGGTGP
ncbi:MAG: alkaline phosphatase family protein [Armatimonadetes bacterium]|nr:alkaline phosphatase family protein [Armatimonadota bacterium]